MAGERERTEWRRAGAKTGKHLEGQKRKLGFELPDKIGESSTNVRSYVASLFDSILAYDDVT